MSVIGALLCFGIWSRVNSLGFTILQKYWNFIITLSFKKKFKNKNVITSTISLRILYDNFGLLVAILWEDQLVLALISHNSKRFLSSILARKSNVNVCYNSPTTFETNMFDGSRIGIISYLRK